MTAKSNKHLIFSYGTLKRGFPNYDVMEKIGARFIAEVRTEFRYPLFVGGEWQVPFLIHQPDAPDAHAIDGELFEVDTAGVAVLDEFEGVADGYYKRHLIAVHPLADRDQIQEVWCYFGGAGAEAMLTDVEDLLSVYDSQQVQDYTPVWDREK